MVHSLYFELSSKCSTSYLLLKVKHNKKIFSTLEYNFAFVYMQFLMFEVDDYLLKES